MNWVKDSLKKINKEIGNKLPEPTNKKEWLEICHSGTKIQCGWNEYEIKKRKIKNPDWINCTCEGSFEWGDPNPVQWRLKED